MSNEINDRRKGWTIDLPQVRRAVTGESFCEWINQLFEKMNTILGIEMDGKTCHEF
jgi:hypothetical protein